MVHDFAVARAEAPNGAQRVACTVVGGFQFGIYLRLLSYENKSNFKKSPQWSPAHCLQDAAEGAEAGAWAEWLADEPAGWLAGWQQPASRRQHTLPPASRPAQTSWTASNPEKTTLNLEG